MSNPNAPHTKLCTICLEIHPTGMTMALHEKWKKNIGQRSAIENSMATINRDFDPSLLLDDICFGCSCDETGSDITVIEEEYENS